MKKIIAVLLLIILPALFYGCWDRREISDLALAVGDAFDQAEIAGKTSVKITFQIINPSTLAGGTGASAGAGASGPSGASGASPFWTVSETGGTVREAIAKTNYRIPKDLFLAHIRVDIFGEEAARSGLIPFLDRLIRSRESRDTKFIAVSKGEAGRILEMESAVSQSTAMALNDTFRDKDGWQGILAVNIADFMYRLSTGLTSPLAPVVEIIPQESLTPKEIETGLINTIAISGLAAFNTEGRLVDFLDERETLGLTWVLNKAKNRILTFPHFIDGMEELVSFSLINAKSKINADIGDNGLPVFEIKTRANFDLIEQFGRHRELATPGLISDFEKTAAGQVINEIVAAVKKSQQINADVFGLGEEFKKKHPREWPQYKDHWQEIYPFVDVTIECETHIYNRELSVEPPGSRTEGDSQ